MNKIAQSRTSALTRIPMYSLVRAGAQSERFSSKLGFVKGVNGNKNG